MLILLDFKGFKTSVPQRLREKRGLPVPSPVTAYTSGKADNHLSQHLSCLDNPVLVGACGKHIRSPGGGKYVLHAVAVFYLMPNIGLC